MIRSKTLAALFTLIPSVALAQPGEPTPPAETPAPTNDDLAKAADATAAAAAVPAANPTAPVATAAPAASNDIDLAALGLDPNSSGFDDKLNVYGFADVEYSAMHLETKSPYIGDTRGFSGGNLNIYVSKNLSKEWRFLGEVRFLYLPNGAEAHDGTITVTSAGDPNDFARPVSWGGILIERAYAEYDVNNYLTIRAGHFLTPYGIWNTDHGSPTIIAAYRPYSIGEQYFPEHQTGLDLFGKARLGTYQLSYHATVSNGRSPVESTSDPDKQLAFGGRIELEAPWAGSLKVGLSGYAGQYTDVPAMVGAPTDSYKERSYGADAQWDHGGLHLQSEIIANEHHYLDGERALSTAGFMPDGRQWGAYGLAGYRTSVAWNVMPYTYAEYLKPIDKTYDDHVIVNIAGLNFRPTSNVVLKVQYAHALLVDGTLLGTLKMDLVNTQLAVVF